MLDFLLMGAVMYALIGAVAGLYLVTQIVYERFIVKSGKSVWDIINEVD